MYPTTAAVRQGCTRSVVIRHKTIPLWNVRKNTASLDVNVRMGLYINYHQKVFILPTKLARSMDTQWRCARSGSTPDGVWWGDKGHARIKESATTIAATRA